MKKKLLLLFTILAIGLSNAWAYDFSAIAPSGQTLYYNISGNTVTVTNGDVNPVGSLVIPESVTYLGVTYPVTAIGYNAFVYSDNLTSVTLPNSVTFIDNAAFGVCFNLRSIYIGCSVSSIAPYAFSRSGVDTLFYNARSLNNPDAFRIISLTYVEIGDSVQSLPSGAFQSQYDLTDVVIHDHLSVIGEYAFRGCHNLIDITIPNSVTSIGIGAFEGCSALTNIVFPDSLVTISANAFKQCTGLTRVSIPNTVTAIGSSAFEGCTGLTSIAIPNGTIGSFAFCNCAGLTSVSIGCSVTSIEGRTFSDCNNVDTLFYNARNLNDQSPSWPCFRPLNLTCLIIGDSVQTIPQYAFYGQQRLVIVEIPDGITSIGDYAFSDCRGLTSAIIPNSVTYLGTRAFENCSSLTNITISNSVNTIKEHTFGDCSSLTKVVIPDSVTTICSWAFYNCAGLTSVSIGCSVTSIGDRAFSGCNNVDTLFYNARNLNDQTPSWPCFGPFNLTCLIIGDSVQTIPQYVFYGQRGLTHVVIPNSVLIIGDGAFEDCSGLCSVVISNSLITIGSNAFEECSQLTSIVLPNTLTSIGHKAFYKCSGLTDIVIPNSVISIGSEAFSFCTGLTSVTIGMSVSSIGYATFLGCSNVTTLYYNARSINAISDDSYCGFKPMNLANLIIGDSVQTIPQNAFAGQSRLSNITIPNSVSIIGDNAFRNCTNVDTLYYNARNMSALSSSSLGFRQMPLNYLRIGNNVQTLPNYVFYGQGGLTNVHIPDSVISIGDYAFYGCRNLDSVTIGESMISIGENAISKANVILSISTTPPSLNSNSLSNVSKSIVPCASVDLYQQAGWPNVVASEGYIYSVTTEDTIEGIVNIDSIPTCPAQTMVFSATPNPGFYFVQWNDGDTNNPRIVTLTQDTSYIAQFDHIHYTITGISSDTSMGTVNGSTTETYMANVTLTAVAKPGCRFIQWNDGSLENPRIVIADSNKNYTAQFDYIQYTITLLQNDSAMGHVDGAGIFQCGSQRTIYAIAASGHHFDQWSDGETLNPRTCTLTCDTVFVATFAKNRYVINTDVNDDTTGFVIGQGSYYYGDSIILRAIPASHCRFLYWSDGSTLNPRPLVVREDVSLTAYFSTMDISTAVDTIIITDTIITYNYIHDTIVVNNFIYDTTIVTQWQYDTTYVNVYVPVHDTTIINNYIHDTTTITQWQYDTTYVNVYIPVHDTTFIDNYIHDTTIVNNYIHDTTTVTQWQYDTTYVNVYVPVHDTTIINNYIHDTTIVNNYIHDTAYVDVYIHDTTIVNNYIHDTTFVELLVHDTLTITEELNWYALSVVSGNSARGLVAGNGRFPENTEVEIAAIPIEGSRFVQWQDGNTDNPRTVTMAGDMNFVATFDVTNESVTDVDMLQHSVTTRLGQIVVENAGDAQIRIFDNLGRCLSTTKSMEQVRVFNMPASGAYMVQVGNCPAQKVIVIK